MSAALPNSLRNLLAKNKKSVSVQVRLSVVTAIACDWNSTTQKTTTMTTGCGARSSVLKGLSGEHFTWPADERISVFDLPAAGETFATDALREASLRLSVWRASTPSAELGFADLPLRQLVSCLADARTRGGRATSRPVSATLKLSSSSSRRRGGTARGYLALTCALRDTGAFCDCRSTAACRDHPNSPPGVVSAVQAAWSDAGGEIAAAACTLNIFEPRLLKRPLEIAVRNENAPDCETCVGQAQIDLEGLCSLLRKKARGADREKAFKVRLNERDVLEHKMLHFTAWLERTRYFALSLWNVQAFTELTASISDGKAYLAVSFFKASSTKTKSSKTLAWHDREPLRLPATLVLLSQHKLRLELWQVGVLSDTLIGVAEASLAALVAGNQTSGKSLRLSAPLKREKGLAPSGRPGLISFTATCTELPDDDTGDTGDDDDDDDGKVQDADFLDAAQALRAYDERCLRRKKPSDYAQHFTPPVAPAKATLELRRVRAQGHAPAPNQIAI